MKKGLLVILLTFLSTILNAQLGVGVGFGMKPSMEVLLSYGVKSKSNIRPLLGIGGSFVLRRYVKGEDYSATLGLSTFGHDIIETGREEMVSFFAFGGVSIWKLEIIGRCGVIEEVPYQNRYDKTQILSTNGYYFIKGKSDYKILVGITTGIDISNHVNTYLGYDLFHKGLLGIRYKF